jgi:uncharacterized membrane protein
VTWPRRLLSIGFITAGLLHFLATQSYTGIVPSYLPAHRALVLISGIAEIAGGVGLVDPRTRRAAGRGLMLLLVLVFPANLDMALHPDRHSIPAGLLWARLPVQGLLIWWVHRAAAQPDARAHAAATG